jgi:hypothetical protein
MGFFSSLYRDNQQIDKNLSTQSVEELHEHGSLYAY